MIRYAFDPAAALADIAAIDPRWKAKADARTQRFVNAGAYSEKSSIWSTTKPVYMKLQHYKCIFCERPFENERYGNIEFDVEHFRPKSSIQAWPNPTIHPVLNYAFPTGGAKDSGYYWLAYDIQNYAASCKVCNSALKSNYFPIGGARGAALSSLGVLSAEQPYLCYPLGTLDEDPEDLLSFVGTIARPTETAGPRRRRGQIIIDFFDLNGREQLHRQRAQMISIVGAPLQADHAGTATDVDRKVIAQLGNPSLPHASCLRSFKRLFDADPATGFLLYEKCREYAFDQTTAAPPEI